MKIETYQFEPKNLSARREVGIFQNVSSELLGHRATLAKAQELNDLKEKISDQLLAQFGALLSPSLVRQAVGDADSLAATTPFPALFLPSLAEEKVRSAQFWSIRQKAIRERTLAFAA